ncbi:MAG: AsmA family protein [Chromatiales bacterium]|jgi:uncharacterized protein involved in outer membrane biogenesis
MKITSSAAGKALLLFLLLAGFFIGLLFLYIRSDQLQSHLVTWVEQETGKQLHIDGDLDWHLLPQLQINASDVRLTGADGTDVLAFRKLLIKADLWSLLQDSFRVEELVLQGLQLEIVRDEQGRINWRQSDDTENNSLDMGERLYLPVESLRLGDARIEYVDRSSNQHLVLDDLQIQLQPQAGQAGGPQYAFAASTQLNDVRRSLQAGIEIDFILELANNIRVSGMQIDLLFDPHESDAPLDLQLAGELFYQPQQKSLTTRGLRLDSQRLNLDASLNASLAWPRDSLLEISIISFSPVALLEFVPQPDWLTWPDNLWRQLSGDLQFEFDDTSVHARNLSIRLDEMQMQGVVDYDWTAAQLSTHFKVDEIQAQPYLALLKSFMEQPRSDSESAELHWSSSLHINNIVFDQGRVEALINKSEIDNGQLLNSSGSIVFRELNANRLLNDIQPLNSILNLQNRKLFSRLDGGLAYGYTADALHLQDVDMQVDRTRIKGQLAYRQSPQSLDSDLVIDRLDLDRYLKQQPITAEQEQQDTNVLESLQQLEQLNGNGRIEIGYLKFRDTEYRGIKLQWSE